LAGSVKRGDVALGERVSRRQRSETRTAKGQAHMGDEQVSSVARWLATLKASATDDSWRTGENREGLIVTRITNAAFLAVLGL